MIDRFSYRFNLWHDEPSFRCSGVYGNNEHNRSVLADEVSEHGFGLLFWHNTADQLHERFYVRLRFRGHLDDWHTKIDVCVPQIVLQIRFVDGDDEGYLELLQQIYGETLVFSWYIVHDKNRRVRTVQGPLGSFNSLFTKKTFVVQTWCVDDRHRAQRVLLEGFVNRIRGRSGNIADDRHILTNDRVDQRRFSNVPPTNDRYVFPKACMGYVHEPSSCIQDFRLPRNRPT